MTVILKNWSYVFLFVLDVTYRIDLTHEKTNLTVYSKSSMNECLICVHSSRNCRSNVTLEYGRTHFVTFLCQNLENIRITAEQSIGTRKLFKFLLHKGRSKCPPIMYFVLCLLELQYCSPLSNFASESWKTRKKADFQ